MLTQERRQARAQLASKAAKAAQHPHDPTKLRAVDDARRDYRFVAATDYVRQLVDSAPPLTLEQRARIASLLVPIGSDGGRAA